MKDKSIIPNKQIFKCMNLIRKKLFPLIIIFIFFSNQTATKEKTRTLDQNHYSLINLVVKGSGLQQLLFSEFPYEPYEVFVKGIPKDNTCKKSCVLEDEINYISLLFNEEINTTENMFLELTNITEIDLSRFDSSNVRNMSMMFSDCTNLEKITFGNTNTSLVQDMYKLFKSCSKLTSIDLFNLDTSSVINMRGMFLNCISLTSINVSRFNTSNAIDMRSVFYGCSEITSIDISNFDTSKVTTISTMFYNTTKLKYINFGNINTSSLVDMSYLFASSKSLTSMDISNFDTSKVEDMSNMFSECSNLRSVNFGNINTTSIKNLMGLFYYCHSLTSVDLSKFNTPNLIDIRWLFFHCYNIQTIIFSELFNTSNVESLYSTFSNCKILTSLNLSFFDTSKVKNMNYLFNNCYKLKILDLSNLVLSNITSMEKTFYACSSLIYVNLFNLQINTNANLFLVIDNVSPNTKFCIQDSYTQSKILAPKNLISNCSDICFNKYIKFDPKTNECIETCSEHNYTYESNSICYNQCPPYTYVSVNNPFTCYDRTIKGYYLNLNESIYKECYHTCDYCYGEGYEINHNCIKCIPGFIFLNDNNIIDEKNCYEKCQYYYYFNESNNYMCTENYICPEKYNKLIIEKNKCIDECYNDNIYKYEFNYTCYKNCPIGTILNESNYICLLNETNEDIIYFSSVIKSYYTDIESKYNNTNQLSTENIEGTLIISTANLISSILKISVNNLLENIHNLTLDVYLEYLRELLSNGLDTKDLDNGIDYIHTEKNVTFTITTPGNQRNNKNKNMTTINLGKCEYILKDEYNISDKNNIYILKVDDYIEGYKTPKVEYEIYYPLISNKMQKADLSLCKNIKIDISIPVNLTLNDLDKYNSTSGLYNDICYTLTSETGTDKCLKDRKEEFINNNLTICEEDCEFIEYDYNKKRALCSCFTKIKIPMISTIRFDKKKLFSNFIDFKNIANIKVLKCTNLLFNKNNIFKNIANYIMTILFIIGISALFIFCFYNNTKIKNFFNRIWKENNIKINKNEPIITFNKKTKTKQKPNKKTIKNKKDKKLNYNEPPKSKVKSVQKVKFKSSKNKANNALTNSNSSKITNITNLNTTNQSKSINKNIKNVKKYDMENSKYAFKIESMKNLEKNKSKNENNSEKENSNKYTDLEKNLFSYEEAIKYDYRTYWEYYKSLLKTKHIFIFTFFECNDYNSQIIKIYIFLFTFAINFTVSAMFYSDDTMHKIYVDKGSFDFTYQLPQMIYSLLIASLLKIILNNLGLYGKSIIEIRNSKKKLMNRSIIKISMFISYKIIFFFIITYILLFFFWIYLGCFCAVYKNTQIHLFIDVSLSFIFSFIPPFIIYLVPGIFRIMSLKNRKNEHPYMYKLSYLIQML